MNFMLWREDLASQRSSSSQRIKDSEEFEDRLKLSKDPKNGQNFSH